MYRILSKQNEQIN